MDNYQGIISYLEFISKEYRLEICINDFMGFLYRDRELYLLLQPFLIHKNPYCMYIKSNRQLWDRCLSLKRRIFEKAQKLKEPYYGMCYCGVEEYIVPILHDNYVIGVICAGEYSCHPQVSEYRIKKIAAESHIDYEQLLEKFHGSVRPFADDKLLIRDLLGIVSEYLAGLYDAGSSVNNHNIGESRKVSSESYVLTHAVEYIKQNFMENVSVKDICDFCHCSESYINHIFKKNMKVNIKAYINRLRIEKAKLYLLNTQESIAEIAGKVGFGDPNYFSSVFCEICGIPPTEYKKRNSC